MNRGVEVCTHSAATLFMFCYGDSSSSLLGGHDFSDGYRKDVLRPGKSKPDAFDVYGVLFSFLSTRHPSSPTLINSVMVIKSSRVKL